MIFKVEAIPMMQMKLSVLKEEKRLLILKLKVNTYFVLEM